MNQIYIDFVLGPGVWCSPNPPVCENFPNAPEFCNQDENNSTLDNKKSNV